MYPAFMLARNGGLRDTEIKTLTWSQVNFVAKTVKVGRAKSEAGEGRVVPLNSEVYQALIDHRACIASGSAKPGTSVRLSLG